MRPAILACSLLAATSLACATEAAIEDKGVESELPLEGATDSLSRPTEHGALRLGDASATLAASTRYHAWTVEVGRGGADLLLETTGARTLDTVMYVYRRQGSGWGSPIARNDDARPGTALSMISTHLAQGTYRVLVKGYRTTTYGAFGLHAECGGAGCPSAALTGAALVRALEDVADGASYMSESDSEPTFVQAPTRSASVTVEAVRSAFGDATLRSWFGEYAPESDLAFDLYSESESRTFQLDLMADDDESGLAFGAIKGRMDAHLTGVRVLKIGPRAADGTLDEDAGTYVILVVGRDSGGAFVGYWVTSVET